MHQLYKFETFKITKNKMRFVMYELYESCSLSNITLTAKLRQKRKVQNPILESSFFVA